MIVATNTAHLDPLYRTPASVPTGWGATTVYTSEDYITDGVSLVETALLKPADRTLLTKRLGVGWPAGRLLPSHKHVSEIVDAALAAPRTPVELLGCAGGAAFLLVGEPERADGLAALTTSVACFLPERLPGDSLMTTTLRPHARQFPAGTTAQVISRQEDNTCLVTLTDAAGDWWHWLAYEDVLDPSTGRPLDPNRVPLIQRQRIVSAARLAYLVKLTGADRITAAQIRTGEIYVLWCGECFAGLLAGGL
jgi:hypothetical protein